ncbi:threonine ammonia-lyase [Oceanibium sediminis]|uniref:threonine ammonia-lyase n=1 Tax=Oceanibium sediminis TaxID=2026339 RepID=UPI000DD36DDF|nr:threonine/serine dehydratase [Oceanibium sediminis]
MSDLEAILAADARLDPVVRRTPVLSSPALDEIAGRRVHVKAECLQHTGSFKFRGGFAAVSAMRAEDRAGGVLAYSSGNHAQGVALAAQMHGCPAVIIMPLDAPKLKIANTRALGAEVVLYDRPGGERREDVGDRLLRKRGLHLVRPYDEPLVIAGQGTVGLELARQADRLGIDRADVLVCCGGGGLSSGIALALADRAPGLRVRPCEPQGFDDVARSLATGERQSNAATSGSICDAILTESPGELTFPILSAHAGPGLVVSDEECLAAMAQAFLRLKLVLEPGGAAALAAALFRGDQIAGDDVIVVATGGNVDPPVFARALSTL